ncbi:MAG: hypothetical protein ACH350_08020 [Parachlamydiaceae bacterium]
MEHVKEIALDLSKGLGEWALAAGRFFQSAQTHFLHLYQEESDPRAQTIPLFENTLFVLALFRSRLVEQIQEGKGVLRRLLAFQKKDDSLDQGNFPLYLHQYPHCQDPALALLLLAPFYWILKQFGHVLGADLRSELEGSARLALDHSLRSHQEKTFPYHLAVRLAAAELAYGLMWNDSEKMIAGQHALEQLAEDQLKGWNTTKQLADILVGLQMVYPSLAQSPWSPLWKKMKETWHPTLASYLGPCLREWQNGEEPQVNLYDLFCGFFSGHFSKRATLLNRHHLEGILIQPPLIGEKGTPLDTFHFSAPPFSIDGEFKQQVWRTLVYSNHACHLLEKKAPLAPTLDKTYTPIRLVWGDLQRFHSFVCQGGNVEKCNFYEDGSRLTMEFSLADQSMEEGEGEQKKEIEFFMDIHRDIQFHINGLPATTFCLGETLDILFKRHRLSLVFDLIEGKGDFLGHIMLGNRPSQIDLKGEKRFQAYDWTIFLRTIRRQTGCRFRLQLTFEAIT